MFLFLELRWPNWLDRTNILRMKGCILSHINNNWISPICTSFINKMWLELEQFAHEIWIKRQWSQDIDIWHIYPGTISPHLQNYSWSSRGETRLGWTRQIFPLVLLTRRPGSWSQPRQGKSSLSSQLRSITVTVTGTAESARLNSWELSVKTHEIQAARVDSCMVSLPVIGQLSAIMSSLLFNEFSHRYLLISSKVMDMNA